MAGFFYVTGGIFHLFLLVCILIFLAYLGDKRDFEKENAKLLKENKSLKNIIDKLGGDL